MNINYLIFLNLFALSFAQLTLIHDGIEREYYMSFPEGTEEACPLIINMHGFGSNALDQQNYSEMDSYAHAENMAVVYPEGINNAWNVGTYWDGNASIDDIGFIDVMIDSIAQNFNIDLDRIYACGMSNGGYMTYELACGLYNKISAFGSVTGNFMLNQNQSCNPDREIPIIHIHGTSDNTVPYNSTFDGSMYVTQSIAFWRVFNGLTEEYVNSVPNFDIFDGTTVEDYTYSKDGSTTLFKHLKVIGGGHQWFGSTVADNYIPFLGLNNHDIHSNTELILFFQDYRLSDFYPQGTPGDVNGDELINVVDVILVVQIILGQINSTPLADMNGDGMVNVQDVIIIVNIILDD